MILSQCGNRRSRSDVVGLGRVKTLLSLERSSLGAVVIHGHHPGLDYARIAARSGWTPMMFMTRVRLGQHVSVQPCVRPLRAVHVTAGHNALRGSGPDQKPAFDNAWG